MKTVIVLVGRHEVTEDRYQPIVKEFQENGWQNVILYQPNWQTDSVEQLVSDFIANIPSNGQSLTLLGFSLGAMIAFIATSRIIVESLILCSPSGYFTEYSDILNNDDSLWLSENLRDYLDFSAVNIVKHAKVSRGVIIAGQAELEECPDFRQWINDLKSQTNWQYIELPETGHEIEALTYQKAIKKVIHDIS